MATALEHPDVSDGAANHPRGLASLPAPLDTGLQWACVSCDAANQARLPVLRLPTPDAALDEEDADSIFNQERDIRKLHFPHQALARATASLSRSGWHVETQS